MQIFGSIATNHGRFVGSWIGIVVHFTFTFAILPSICSSDIAPPSLRGVVKSSAGEPVVAASIFIDSARPKKGQSPLCPSCYADCAKRTHSTYDGTFTITALDPKLAFDVLITAPGFKPQIFEKVDPAQQPLAVTLEPMDAAKIESDHFVTGQIQDEQGAPIADVTVTPQEFKTNAVSGFMPDVLDPLAISDGHGGFIITSKQKITHASFKFHARGFAPQVVREWLPGKRDQRVRLNRGTTVTGRVMHAGTPVPHAHIGLVQTNRSFQGFYGEMTTECDGHGCFSFFNVPGGEEYFVYGMMDDLKPRGALPAQRISPGPPDTTLHTGDLQVLPGYTLKGRVVLSDRSKIPAHTMILLCRDEAWDHQQTEVAEDGCFEFQGLPDESYSLNIRIAGYKVSSKNQSLDRYSRNCLIGRISETITDLRVLMESGGKSPESFDPQEFQELEKSGWSQQKTKQAPLRGVARSLE